MKLDGGTWLISRLSEGSRQDAGTSLKFTVMVEIMSGLFMAL